MGRRENPDPLLLQTVSQRLARLLAETAPRRAEEGDDPPEVPDAPVRVPVEDVGEEELPEPPRFRRMHVGVVAVLLLAGLLWSGYSVLRARPVALATPGPVVVAPAPGDAAGAAPPTPTAGSSPTPTAIAVTPARVVVHVLGAVRTPGLVTLPAPARVQDAVDAAGGLVRSADAGNLNLAQVLEDGQQVVIGTDDRPEGEVRGSGGSGAATGGGSAGRGAGGAPGESAGAVLNLNEADTTQLEELPGIGPVTAAAIVAWRDEHRRFSRVEELQEVDGIGPKTFAQIVSRVRV